MEENAMMTSPNQDEARRHNVLTLQQGSPQRPLWLTREEALQLLELSITSNAALTYDEAGALSKLGELCRAFLRGQAASW
jgi:hypothetical protein